MHSSPRAMISPSTGFYFEKHDDGRHFQCYSNTSHWRNVCHWCYCCWLILLKIPAGIFCYCFVIFRGWKVCSKFVRIITYNHCLPLCRMHKHFHYYLMNSKIFYFSLHFAFYPLWFYLCVIILGSIIRLHCIYIYTDTQCPCVYIYWLDVSLL